jgi:hypothetical protein
LKDLNKDPTPQLVYNQMWLDLFMDDCHFNNIAKINNFFFNLIILGKINNCNFSKNGHILYKEKNIVKDLMNAFFNSH